MANASFLRRVLSLLEPALRAIEWVSMLIAGSCFVAIVLVTATDVFRRYVLNAPLSWAFTLVSDYLMVAVFFLAIGSTQRFKQNVGVDLVTRRLPSRPRAALAVLTSLLVLLFVGVAGSAGWQVFVDAWDGGDVSAGSIAWPTWPSVILVPMGFFLLGLRLLADLLGSLAALFGAEDLAPQRSAASGHGFGLE